MERDTAPHVMVWFNVRSCLPLTFLVVGWLCYKARREQVSVYYMNLIISNLIQLCTIVWVTNKHEYVVPPPSVAVYVITVMTSLGFRMCMALERYFVLACPQLSCIRQVKGSVLVCVAVWVFVFVTVLPPLCLDEQVYVCILALLPALVFIICLAGTLKSVCQTPPAASTVSAEEKRRIVGILVLMLLSYILTILPAAVTAIIGFPYPYPCRHHYYYYYYNYNHDHTIVMIVYTSILLSPFLDLILFVFLYKGPIDKLLMRLCCCRMENAASSDGSRSSV